MRSLSSLAVGSAFVLGASTFALQARADDVLHVGAASLDPPTVVALGAQLMVTGDDNFNATVTVRYRPSGTSAWRGAMSLFRVHPADVTGLTVPSQFAGSIFDITPGTSYDIELHAVDPDGSVDQTVSLSGTTRTVPGDPQNPSPKTVTNASELDTALNSAQPGDVITLQNGTYSGNFSIDASGTAQNPIVIRGASQDGVILDGGGCTGCNIFEVYGSFVHVETLTLAHASRAFRFQGQDTESNVVRYVHIEDAILGIGSNTNQQNYYICDNILEGRLAWPSVYTDDGGAHANDDGIHVQGNGHVICHNRLVGFGDALKTEQDGARAVDFYGNEVLSAYDNALELDGSAGNVRAFRNRFTNTYATLSYQPVFGGPTYTFRNVVVNVVNEQMKFHNETSGNLVFHNTFVSPGTALGLHDGTTSHHFVIENNLFVTATSTGGRTMDWTGGIDDGTFDYNGFFPDGVVDFNYVASGYTRYDTFGEARAAHPQFEPHGLLLTSPIFANGLSAPADYVTALQPQDVTLAGGSNAIDKGLVLPNVNDGFSGGGPDLGAYEVGCAIPIYGPRAVGTDEANEPIGCGSPNAPDGGVGGAPGSGGAPGVGGSSGAAGTAGSPNGGTAGASGATNGGTAGSSGAAATSGAAGSTNGSGGNGAGATNGGSGASGTAGSNAAAADSGDTGGCGCRTAPTSGSNAFALLALAASAFLRRRRS